MDPVQVAHLLRRTEYVVRPERLDAFTDAGVTREDAVDDILNVTVPVALPAYLDHDIEGEGYDQWVYAVQWWLDRMVDSRVTLHDALARRHLRAVGIRAIAQAHGAFGAAPVVGMCGEPRPQLHRVALEPRQALRVPRPPRCRGSVRWVGRPLLRRVGR